MARNRIATALAGLSLFLAVTALLFVTLWPNAYEGKSVRPNPNGEVVAVESTSASLIEENGLGVLWALAFPAGLAAAGFMASFRPNWVGRATLWAAAVLLMLFSWATGFTIGLFYIPAAIALLAAVIFHTRARYTS